MEDFKDLDIKQDDVLETVPESFPVVEVEGEF